MKIPSKFKLFGTTINVVWDNKQCNDKGAYGLSSHATSEIVLSNAAGFDSVSESVIIDTFYHERTHAILDAMHENELSENEKFVDVFSKLLRQSDETMVFDNDEDILTRYK